MAELAVPLAKPSSAPGPFRPAMRLGTASVGPRQWQDETVKTLKLGRALNKKAEKDKEYGRMHDTLPNVRDGLVRSSNVVALGYMREVRVVVVKLREHLLMTNEEVKLLLKSKEFIERTLDYVRKDVLINRKSVDIRKQRPKREKEYDEADKLLEDEKRALDEQKKTLEVTLRRVKRQLIALDQSRKRLARVLDERNQVLDLICHSKNSMKHDHLLRAQLMGGGETTRPYTTATSGMATPKVDSTTINEVLAKTATVAEDLKRELAAVERGAKGEMMRAGVYTNRTAYGGPFGDSERPGTPPISNLGPYTPEAALAIDECRELIGESRKLRVEVAASVDECGKTQHSAHASVNDALTQRLAETVTLMQHLNMGEAENRTNFNKSVRHYEMTDVTRGHTLGPQSYRDLRTSERLDRPIMKVYQRHPGTNPPDARDLIRGNNNLEISLEKTQKNLALLHLSNIRIKEDQRDKKAAADIDAQIIRFRRKKADHRWVPGEIM